MSHSLKALNGHLFDQLDRLKNSPPESLEGEILRAKAVEGVASKILRTGDLVVRAAEISAEYRGSEGLTQLEQLTDSK